MNKIKSIILDQTNWLEVTLVKVETITLPQEVVEGVADMVLRTQEVETILHCESFGDSDEYQELLRQRLQEFEVESTEELENTLQEQVSKRYIPTPEEIEAQKEEEARKLLEQQISEAKQYLANTGWYIERLNDPSSGKAIPEEVLAKRAEARELINTLEAELGESNGVYR